VFRRTPDYNFLCTFGCLCFPFLRPYHAHKLDFRSSPCVFLGYSSSHLGYRCLDLESDRIYVSRHVRFHENVFPFAKSEQVTSLPVPPTPPTYLPSLHPPPSFQPTTYQTMALCRPLLISSSASSRYRSHFSMPSCTSTSHGSSSKAALSTATAAASAVSFNRVVSPPSHEPLVFNDANKYEVWHSAMREEIQALRTNKTWTLVPFHHSMNVVGSRWVYKIKRRSDGSIERYKARLVARGFTQQEGIEYSETFNPVIKQATVRLVFSIAVSCDWKIHQLDIHNAFLNDVLDEDVYMKQPPSFVDSALPSHVCRLHKSLYGLKQAPRAWYTRLNDFLLSIGFRASKVDTSLFIFSVGVDICYLLVYVDDILFRGSNSLLLQRLIQLLSSEFKLRDLGYVHYFLGIEVQSTSMGLMLCHHKYILDILTRAGMLSCKPVDTLISTSKATILPDPLFSNATRFRQIVGALQYLTFTHPNICFAVNRVCQFMHAPTDSH